MRPAAVARDRPRSTWAGVSSSPFGVNEWLLAPAASREKVSCGLVPRGLVTDAYHYESKAANGSFSGTLHQHETHLSAVASAATVGGYARHCIHHTTLFITFL